MSPDSGSSHEDVALRAAWILQYLVPGLRGTEARVVLVGADTEKLATTASHVALLGFVEDVAEVISAASVCIAPLQSAAGVSTKILDYVCQGSRVLATPIAASGFEGCPGITIASLEAFPAALQRLLEHRESVTEVTARREAQARWYEARCGEAHLSEQWRDILRRVGLAFDEDGIACAKG